MTRLTKDYGYLLRDKRNGTNEVWIRCTRNDDGTWYAVARGAFGGCSKDHATADYAAQSLLDAECVSVVGPLA